MLKYLSFKLSLIPSFKMSINEGRKKKKKKRRTVTRMDPERLVKISWDNVFVGG